MLLLIKYSYRRTPHIQPSSDWAEKTHKKSDIQRSKQTSFKNSRALILEENTHRKQTQLLSMY